MPANAHRVGLNKYQKAPPLLKSINRPESRGLRSFAARNASPEAAPLDGNQSEGSEQDESHIYAQPLGDDEEDFRSRHISHSSDEEELGRGDIPPTTFEVKGPIRSQPTRKTTDDDGIAPIRETISAICSASRKNSPSRSLRRNASESANKISKKARLEMSSVNEAKEREIFNIASSQSRTKTIRKYGSHGKSQGFRGSQSNCGSTPEVVFKQPPKVELDLLSSPKKQFKIPERVASEEPEMGAEKVFKTFDVPIRSPDSSPFKRAQSKFGSDLSKLPELTDNMPLFRTPEVMELLKSNTSLMKDFSDRVPFRALENGEDAQSQSHIFRMPSMPSIAPSYTQVETDEANSLEDNSLEIPPLSPEIAPKAACPMCGESVDAIFLRNYNGGERMNIRMQAKFCRAHKKNSARNEWAEKGYPTICWSDFNIRLAQHHSFLESLLDGASSYYRNILAEQVRSGKDRTLLQAVSNSENSLAPGYYGSRGFRAMSENIIDKFSSQLRKIAVTDRLVAARGVIGYVQNVLVPELAVRLICEDMDLGVEEARQVMRESVGLGDLLNEEMQDEVTWKEGDETL